MEAKQIRLCTGCGKEHNTGVETKSTGEFKPIEKCIDCLMAGTKFLIPTKRIHLNADDVEVEGSGFFRKQEPLGSEDVPFTELAD